MYLVVFDGRALKEDRKYLFNTGEYCKKIYSKFPQIKEIRKEDIEEILILSLMKIDDELNVRLAKCKDFVVEENRIRIDYDDIVVHNEKSIDVKKRVLRYLYNTGLQTQGVKEFPPTICLVENIGSYNAIKNKSLVVDPTFAGKIDKYKKMREWDKIVEMFPKKENIENTEFWNDTYCLNELYFALSKLCEGGNKRISSLDKKRYEEYFLFVVERCIKIEPEIFTHKSVLAYHYYNVFTNHKTLSNGIYEKAVSLYEDLVGTSTEKFKEKYRYAKIRQYYFETFGYTLGKKERYNMLSKLLQDYEKVIDSYSGLDEERQKRYKKEYVKALYGYSKLTIDYLILDWATYSSARLENSTIKSYYLAKERLEKVNVVEKYLTQMIIEENYESGNYKLGKTPNYLHVLYRIAKLEQHKGIVYIVNGLVDKANKFFEKSNDIVKRVLDIAHQKRTQGERFKFPDFIKTTRAINYFFLHNEEQCHRCFNKSEAYMLYDEALMYYFSGKKQQALNILREIPSNDMRYEKAQSFMKRIENEL